MAWHRKVCTNCGFTFPWEKIGGLRDIRERILHCENCPDEMSVKRHWEIHDITFAIFKKAYDAAVREFNKPVTYNPWGNMTRDEIESLNRASFEYIRDNYGVVAKYAEFLARAKQVGII